MTESQKTMTKLLLPFSSYLVGLVILLLLYPNHNTSGKDFFQIIPFLIFWITTISVIISLSLSIFSFIKKKIFPGSINLISTVSIYVIYKKLIFVDYNTFVHLFFIFVLLTLLIIYLKQRPQRLVVSIFLITNLMTFFLSDHFFLSYFNSTKIPWNEKGLIWEDFKDSFYIHRNEKHFDSNLNEIDPNLVRAITTNSIKYKINIKGSIPSVVVGAYFTPNESYVKDEFKTASQLNHECGYVDICEYHTRIIKQIFRNKTIGMVEYKSLFKKYDIFYIDGIVSDIDNAERFIERIIDRKKEMNEQYMFETEFGQNLKEQKKWDTKIKKLLTKLEEYK